MSGHEETTLRLEETAARERPFGGLAVRWRLPGPRVRYTRLDREHLTIGRGETQTIRLDASGVSRAHAELSRQGPVYALHDVGSTNGTYVNGRRVAHVALSSGDVLRLGDVIGVVLRLPQDVPFEEEDVVRVGDETVFGPCLQSQLAAIQRVGPSKLPVVIQGETGSGKERIARALHSFSGRSGPFHAVNCAALPAGLAESELFGFRKGAFTGAEQAHLGHFRAAQGGTLFLDELAELPLPLQAKLLRVIQEAEVTPLGETRSHALDVRLLAAVQEPIERLVEDKRLREDLAMRLRGLVLVLPPLRERRADTAVFFDDFLRRYSGGRPPAVEPKLLESILMHEFPGNVRELELVTQQLLTLHGHEPTLRRSMLPEGMRRQSVVELETPTAAPADRRDHDLRRLADELRKNGCNLARAAATIGVSRQRAYRLLDGRTPAQLLDELPPGPPAETEE